MFVSTTEAAANVNALREAINANTVRAQSIDFAKSLVDQFEKKGKLSAKQLEWVAKLAVPAPPPVQVMTSTAVAAVLTFFANAKLKYPALVLTTESGRHVRLYRAGSQSKAPGTVVVQGEGVGRDYLGRVELTGVYQPSLKYPEQEDVLELLGDLGGDPKATVAAYGKKTGCCSFCSKPLEDERSLHVGYGPVCAKNWGLPYPKKSEIN